MRVMKKTIWISRDGKGVAFWNGEPEFVAGEFYDSGRPPLAELTDLEFHFLFLGADKLAKNQKIKFEKPVLKVV